MSDVSESNGNGHAPESRLLSVTGRRPLGKSGDYITRAQCAKLIQDALASELPKIHEFYLNQIPGHTARMIQDALVHFGVITLLPPAVEGEQPTLAPTVETPTVETPAEPAA